MKSPQQFCLLFKEKETEIEEDLEHVLEGISQENAAFTARKLARVPLGDGGVY